MKLLPVLLLNLATVGVGLVAYDQLRGEASPPAPVAESARSDHAELARRIEVLEAMSHPVLGGGGTDPRVLARLDALEEAVQIRLAADEPPVTSEAPDEPSPPQAAPTSPAAAEEEPTAEEVRRWRRVREAVRREESIRRNRPRFDRALDELPLSLTPRQRTKIYAAYAAFEPRIGEIWAEVRSQAQATIAAGGVIDRQQIVAETTVVIQQEFAETLTGIVHAADAAAVAGAMLAGGR